MSEGGRRDRLEVVECGSESEEEISKLNLWAEGFKWAGSRRCQVHGVDVDLGSDVRQAGMRAGELSHLVTMTLRCAVYEVCPSEQRPFRCCWIFQQGGRLREMQFHLPELETQVPWGKTRP